MGRRLNESPCSGTAIDPRKRSRYLRHGYIPIQVVYALPLLKAMFNDLLSNNGDRADIQALRTALSPLIIKRMFSNCNGCASPLPLEPESAVMVGIERK